MKSQTFTPEHSCTALALKQFKSCFHSSLVRFMTTLIHRIVYKTLCQHKLIRHVLTITVHTTYSGLYTALERYLHTATLHTHIEVDLLVFTADTHTHITTHKYNAHTIIDVLHPFISENEYEL